MDRHLASIISSKPEKNLTASAVQASEHVTHACVPLYTSLVFVLVKQLVPAEPSYIADSWVAGKFLGRYQLEGHYKVI